MTTSQYHYVAATPDDQSHASGKACPAVETDSGSSTVSVPECTSQTWTSLCASYCHGYVAALDHLATSEAARGRSASAAAATAVPRSAQSMALL